MGGAQAHPWTRTPRDPALAEAAAAGPWDEVEAGLRAAVTAELGLLGPELGDWEQAAARLERSRLQGDWMARWHLRVLDEALRAQDLVGAERALDAAERCSGRTYPRKRWALARLRALDSVRALGPWLVVGLGALGLGVLLDRGTERRVRERRPVLRINPYVTGRPLNDPSLVFGRDGMLAAVQRGLREGRSHYLTGERRIGKTTLLLQLGEQNRRSGGVSVFVDVAGSSGDQALAALLRALRAAARDQRLSTEGSPTALAQRLAQRGTLLLLVDEVDALNNATPATRAVFRRLALEPQAPARLVAAGVGLDLGRDEEARAWAKRLVVLEVGPLGDEAARRLLTEPVARSLSWTEAALQRVLRAARGRPMVIQLYGLNVVDRLSGGRRSRVLPLDVDEARPAVERAWQAIQDQGLEGGAPVDLDMVYLELTRLSQEIEDLERQRAVSH